jgi:hypothetical protein
MRRISDFTRRSTAADIMRRITGAADLPDAERDALFVHIVSAEAQRVLNLMHHVAADSKRRASNAVESAMATFMEGAITLDPTAENGLSKEATCSLAVACQALAEQMSEDCKRGKLDQDRVEMLIGGGPGAFVVGTALAKKFALRFPDR